MESTKRQAKWKNGVLPGIIVSATWYSSAWSWQLNFGQNMLFFFFFFSLNYIFYHKESWSWVTPKILRRFSAITISSFLYICYMEYSKRASKTDLISVPPPEGKLPLLPLLGHSIFIVFFFIELKQKFWSEDHILMHSKLFFLFSL